MKIFNAILGGWKAFWKGFHVCFQWASFYKTVLLIIGLLCPKKVYPATDTKKKYGIVICARNERLVIGNLIDSIRAQTYPADLLTIFVVADNCTDNTAEICREKGCVVYERHDPDHARKGWAMEFLFEQIARDYSINAFDGYVVFDADNLLHPTFMEELNKAFVATKDSIVVGYRNTKNFDQNFISAGYGIHFIRSVVSYHRPRGFIGSSTHIAGTGYVIPSRLVKDGWHYTCLTEDTEFTMNSVADGEFVAFCEDAEFYDEQPYQVKVMARQRMRWTKGRLFAFFSTFPRLFAGIFKRKGIERFSCYDMIMYCFPNSVYQATREMVFPLLEWLATFIAALLLGNAMGVGETAASGTDQNLVLVVWAMIATPLWKLVKAFLTASLKGALIVLREHKHIHCKPWKLVLYTFLFPWFDLIGGPLSIMALFSTTQWKPIKHDAAISIDQLMGKSGDSQ